MEIIVAKSGGFCQGVKKAVDTALTIEAENTYIFGEIIHNQGLTFSKAPDLRLLASKHIPTKTSSIFTSSKH